jgi:hypothetical protein
MSGRHQLTARGTRRIASAARVTRQPGGRA